jgi:Integrase core domain
MTSIPRKLLANPEDPREPPLVRRGAHSRKGPERCLVILDERHLLSVLREFVTYYNQDRPHRTLGLQTPEPRLHPTTGPIRTRPVLNGLHHVYERAA